VAADRRDVRGLDASIGEAATKRLSQAVQHEARRQSRLAAAIDEPIIRSSPDRVGENGLIVAS
jgi:hypothetical protein